MSTRFRTRCRLSGALLLAGALAAVAAEPAPGRTQQIRCTYQVADLVIPVHNQPLTCRPESSEPLRTQEGVLIRLITSTVEPGSWSEMGGPGTIEYFPLTMSLVINQTPDIQEQVADLLAVLRRQRDQEVAVEVRFVTIPEDFLERVGADFNLSSRTPGVAFLNDTQVSRFLEAAQGDCRTYVMQAPKLTTFNGQTANLDVTDRQNYVTGVDLVDRQGQVACGPRTETFSTGLRVSVRPVISADRRSMSVRVSASMTNLDTPAVPLLPVVMPVTPREADGSPGQPVVFTQFIQQPKFTTLALEKTLKVPDGHTAVLSGWTQEREGRNEYGPPILSKIPYVNRRFDNVDHGRSREHILVMVTPRIVVPQEEEIRQTGCVTPPAKTKDPVKRKVAELMQRFNALYKEGKYREAESLAMRAKELKESEILRVLNHAGDPGDAARVTEHKGIAIDPKAAEISQQRKPLANFAGPRKGPKEREIEQRLTTPVTLNFKDAPLRQVLEDIRAYYNLNIYIDEPALAQDGIALSSKVSVTFDQISLRSALKLLLSGVHLTYVIRDEVLVITTPSHAKGAQQRATYQVADLVTPINDSGGLNQTSATPVAGATMNRPGAPSMPPPVTGPNTLQPGTPAGAGSGSGGSPFGGGTADNVGVTKQRSKTTEESLMRLITSTVEPGSWSERGGPGTIEYHPLTMALVINQTPDIQEQIADLLAALRRYAAPPAAKEDPVKRKAAELMKRFNTLYKEGRYHEAEVCATAAHVLAPEDPAAIAAIEVARKHGCPAASAERAPVSECPCASKAHRLPREIQEVTPR